MVVSSWSSERSGQILNISLEVIAGLYFGLKDQVCCQALLSEFSIRRSGLRRGCVRLGSAGAASPRIAYFPQFPWGNNGAPERAFPVLAMGAQESGAFRTMAALRRRRAENSSGRPGY